MFPHNFAVWSFTHSKIFSTNEDLEAWKIRKPIFIEKLLRKCVFSMIFHHHLYVNSIEYNKHGTQWFNLNIIKLSRVVCENLDWESTKLYSLDIYFNKQCSHKKVVMKNNVAHEILYMVLFLIFHSVHFYFLLVWSLVGQ